MCQSVLSLVAAVLGAPRHFTLGSRAVVRAGGSPPPALVLLWPPWRSRACLWAGEKGYTIEKFLDRCRQQVPQLRGCGADQLIYIKEDLILPHSLTFYELIVKKARGKSGPLFNFDVHEDIRVGPSDSRVEKDESHPGKVMMRHVYTRLKEQFPYSRFEVYDPEKKWDTYTTHGSETYGEGTDTAIGSFGVIRK